MCLARPPLLQNEARFGPNYSLRCKTDDTVNDFNLNIALKHEVSSFYLIHTHLRSFLFDLSKWNVEIMVKRSNRKASNAQHSLATGGKIYIYVTWEINIKGKWNQSIQRDELKQSKNKTFTLLCFQWKLKQPGKLPWQHLCLKWSLWSIKGLLARKLL